MHEQQSDLFKDAPLSETKEELVEGSRPDLTADQALGMFAHVLSDSPICRGRFFSSTEMIFNSRKKGRKAL